MSEPTRGDTVLPNFVIIGAMKAGTTSLYQYLGTHPEIFMTSPKELSFFSFNWERGQSWYESQFEAAGEARALGEATPNYTKAHLWPDAASRMASLIPAARLVYVLREPVERCRSHYLHHVADGVERRPIERALREEEEPQTLDYLQTSRYAFQLERYLEHFHRRQILVVLSDHLMHRRLDTLQRVFGFLDVDESWIPPNLNRQAHGTSQKVLAHPVARRIRQLPGYRALAHHTPQRFKKSARRLTSRPVQTEMSEDLRLHVRERLRPDVGRLASLLDLPDFDGWGML